MTAARGATDTGDTRVGENQPDVQSRDSRTRAVNALESSMATTDYGVVAWFNRDFGFGFIQPDDGGPDVFLHISQISNADSGVPQVGQRISYRIDGSPRRPAAYTAHLL